MAFCWCDVRAQSLKFRVAQLESISFSPGHTCASLRENSLPLPGMNNCGERTAALVLRIITPPTGRPQSQRDVTATTSYNQKPTAKAGLLTCNLFVVGVARPDILVQLYDLHARCRLPRVSRTTVRPSHRPTVSGLAADVWGRKTHVKECLCVLQVI